MILPKIGLFLELGLLSAIPAFFQGTTTDAAIVGRVSQILILKTIDDDTAMQEEWNVRGGSVIAPNGKKIEDVSLRNSEDGGPCAPPSPFEDPQGFYWCDFYYSGIKEGGDFCLEEGDSFRVSGLDIGVVNGANPMWDITWTEVEAEDERNLGDLGSSLGRRFFQKEGSSSERQGRIFMYYGEVDGTCEEAYSRELQSSTASPTDSPTKSPTKGPTASPTASPTDSPTKSPTKGPTASPTATPTESPTKAPTKGPTASPSSPPSGGPTVSPSSSCDLDATQALQENYQAVATAASVCETNLDGLYSTLTTADTFVGAVHTVATAAKSINETTTIFDEYASKLSFFTDKIPKLGPVIRALRNVIVRLGEAGRPLAKKEEELGYLSNVLSGAKDVVGVTKETMKLTELYHGLAHGFLGEFMTCSQNNDCAFDSDMELFATNQVDLGLANLLSDCGELNINFDFDLPELNLGFITEITDALTEAKEWLGAIVDELEGAATYAMCCDNVLRTFGDIAGGLSDIANLATCWVDGALEETVGAALQELIDASLLPLLEKANTELIRPVDGFIEEINNLSFLVPTMTKGLNLPSIGTQDCQFVITDFEAYVKFDKILMNLVNIDPVGEFTLDNDSSTIGSGIVQACSDALAALDSNDEVDCCDIARTCDAEDQIILFEGNACTQNIAGTIDVPSLGSSTTHSAGDALCLANDEARSVLLVGPLQAGLHIEVGDDPDDFCTDDFTIITLMRDLAPEQKLCIPSFEVDLPSSGPVRWEYENSNFLIRHDKYNGLDGKISKFKVSNSGSTTKSSMCDNLGTCDDCLNNSQCASGTCYLNKCALDNGLMSLNCKCEDDGDCDTKRCEGSLFETRYCRATLDNCDDVCDEDSDCTSGHCTYFAALFGSRCANEDGKMDLGCYCSVDPDCVKLGTREGICSDNKCTDGTTGNICGFDEDCLNSRCVYGICRAGNTGDPCEKDPDCVNGRCVDDFCRDGANGDVCEKDTDCDTERCDTTCKSRLGKCSACNENSDCISNKCSKFPAGGKCANTAGKMDLGCYCSIDGDCASTICADNKCTNGGTGNKCGNDNDCLNRRCVKDYCRAGNNGDPCEKDSDCNSGRCDGTCKSKLNSGSSCNENSDCKSNNCHVPVWYKPYEWKCK